LKAGTERQADEYEAFFMQKLVIYWLFDASFSAFDPLLWASGSRVIDAELMQYRNPVGGGPSLKT